MDWRRMAGKLREGQDAPEPEADGSDRLAEGLADIIAEAERRNAAEIEKLRNRVAALESRLQKHGAPDADAAARRRPERDGPEERELQALADLRGEMEELRTAMIKLSGRVKAAAGA